MFDKGIKKYIFNPSLGLIPLIVYFISYFFFKSIGISLAASIAFAIIAEVFIKFYTKSGRNGMVFLLTLTSLSLTLGFWLLTKHKITNLDIYLVLPEIFLICLFGISRLSKIYLNLHFFNKKDVIPRNFVHQFYETAVFVQTFLTAHLFVLLVYLFTKNGEAINEVQHTSVFIIIPVVIMLVIILYEIVKVARVSDKLDKEEWLPIVNEKGEVTGRVAKSVSLKMTNKFLHPVVRVALVHKNTIYLQNRKNDDILDPGALDHPFEKYMLFGNEVNLSVRNSIISVMGRELPFRFLVKYTFENKNTKRLIFLFVSVLEDESEIENDSGLHGKFWTMKQIEGDFGDDTLFSECFQLEYEYIKNTVLVPDNSMRKTEDSENN